MHFADKAPDSTCGLRKKTNTSAIEKPWYGTEERDIYDPVVKAKTNQDHQLLFTIKSSTRGAVESNGQMEKVVIPIFQPLYGTFGRRYDDKAMPKTLSNNNDTECNLPSDMKITFSSEYVLEIEFPGRWKL